MINYAATTDESLVELYLRGDEAAFQALVERYLPLVFGLARKYTGERYKASDIAQETFVKVWKNIRRFDTRRSFRAWLFVIAQHTALDWLRGKEIPFSATAFDVLEPASDEDVSAKLATKMSAEKVRAQMHDLGPEAQKIIQLHSEEGLTFKEIGQALGKSLNTVKSIYRRAVLQLQSRLSEDS